MTDDPARDALSRLLARQETLAVAESLTGGLVCAALTEISGSSAVVRGGVVAYATDVKAGVVGVDPALLSAGGPVQAEVAVQLARGVRDLLGADWGVATTGVAGPGPADGHPAGTVFIAVCGERSRVERLDLDAQAGRSGVRDASVAAVLRLLAAALSDAE
ncbi:CinA family protein [Gephyromycinifex aptenodytis]|uniref:CinA family protein n=1 Tax=Gephyromycinifex aptenodytis TaxID=2716227 RepID=UPI001D02B3F9|nr:nicotinamide-nucleotide amidohydrolase family protein [Gephyromycinifex aptenodytis]